MAPISLALVGCGRLGQRHLQAIIHCPDALLAATVDVEGEKARAAAVAFDASAYDSLTALLANGPRIDGLIIATPSGTHQGLAREALEHDLHVLVERPMTLALRETAELVRLAQSRGKYLAVTHSHRLVESVSTALDRCRTGRLGRILEGNAALRWSRPQSYYDVPAWRGNAAMDGGVIWNQALHMVDLVAAFAGPVDTVFALTATLSHRMESEDTAVAVLQCRNGALFTFNATTSVHNNDLEERLTIVGDQGSIVLGPTLREIDQWLVEGDDEEALRHRFAQPSAQASWHHQWLALEDFRQAIQTGRAPELAADRVMHAAEIVEALYASARAGGPVSVQ